LYDTIRIVLFATVPPFSRHRAAQLHSGRLEAPLFRNPPPPVPPPEPIILMAKTGEE
jgi:hypothetical protein